MQKKLGLVLAGGGGKGAYQIGVWKYLKEIGLTDKIEVISGTSVGGLNAALMATDDYESAERIWTTKIEDSIVSVDKLKFKENIFDNYDISDGVFNREKLKFIMQNDVNLRAISECPKKIYATCIQAENAITAVLDSEETIRHAFLLNKKDNSSIINILLATSAIPVVFPPVYYNGMTLIDGGTPCSAKDNIPVTPLYDEKCTDAIIVCLTDNHYEINESYFPKDKFGNPKSHFKKINEIRIIPEGGLGDAFSGTLNFSPQTAINNIERGYNDAKRLSKTFKTLLEKYDTKNDKEQILSLESKPIKESYEMTDAQKEIIEKCNLLSKIVEDSNLSSELTKSIKQLSDIVEQTEIIVPVIGPFSAGKSTMLNTLLGGKRILPEKITPETALATELHFTTSDEHIDAFTVEGNIENFEATEQSIKYITANAVNYSYAKLYLKNEMLKSIQPIILVDMPGFDSPNEAHNKAIRNYIDKGLHYIVLSPVTDGTVKDTLLRSISEITAMNRKFSFFISKADKLTKTSVEEIRQNIDDVLYNNFGQTVVAEINNKNTDQVLHCLQSINPNNLVKAVFRSELLIMISSIINSLNIRISGANLDEESIKRLQKNLEKTINELESKSNIDIRQIENRYSGVMINNIVNKVRDSLNASTEDLIGGIIAGNNIETHINEIIQSALVEAVQNELGSVTDNIIMDFSDSLKDISLDFSNLNIDNNYLSNMTDTVKNMLSSYLGKGASPFDGKISKNITQIMEKKETFIFSKVLGVGIAALVPGIGPILGIVTAVLPDVLGVFFGKNKTQNKQNQVREEIRMKLTNEVYPSICAKLRKELPKELSSHVDSIILAIKEQYAQNINLQKAEIQNQIELKKNSGTENASVLENMKKYRENIFTISKEISAWEI